MMTVEPRLIIDGQARMTAARFDVINPATGVAFTTCPQAGPADLDDAVAAARRAFPAWAAISIDDRAARLLAIADALEARKAEIIQLLSTEQGKPMAGGAAGEVGAAIMWTRFTAGLRPEVELIQDDATARIELHRRPLGVVASITPWNHPVLIAAWHIMPALLAGNCVVIKPSSYTPLSTLQLVQIAAGLLPPGVLNAVTGEGAMGQAISGHPGIDKIVFTGSTPTGRRIMANAARNLKRLTLELGGNDAAIILPDADVDAIAPKIFAKAFGNSGQTCAALKRLYVHDSLHDALAVRLADLARAARMGPGDDPQSQFGPVQNRAQFDRVCELAADARAQGGRFLTGGEPLPGPGYFFPLSVVVDVTDGMRVVDEEQFGPILPIIRYHDVEDALARANAGENGLGGSVWSSDVATATLLAQRLVCGTAWVNDHASLSPAAPFGGAKQSGIGVEFGLHGLQEYQQVQVLRVAR